MQRFFRLTIGGCILLLLLCGGAVALGRVQPAQDVIPGLTECDGLPCYRGIVLNKTTIKDALATLTQLPGAALGLDGRSVLLPDGPIQDIDLFAASGSPVQTDSDIVREMSLQTRADAIDVGTLIAYAGTPCTIQLAIVTTGARYPYEMRVGYSMVNFWVETAKLVMEPHISVVQIDLIPSMSPGALAIDGLLPPCQTASAAPEHLWRGFTRYQAPQP